MSTGLSVLTVAWFPPAGADSGERVRLRALAAHLAELPGVDRSTVLSFSDDRPREAGPVEDVRVAPVTPNRYGRGAKVRAALTWRSVHEIVLANDRTRRAVVEALDRSRPDVVIAHGLASWPLIPPAWRARSAYDSLNAEAARLERMAAQAPLPARLPLRQQVFLVKRLEGRISAAAGQVWCCSPEDEAHFAAAGARTVLVPNGTDRPADRWSAEGRSGRPVRLLFVGSLPYSANLDGLRWFHDEWARSSMTAWTLDIVGSGDPTAVRALFAGDDRVRVVGRVDDVSASYREHDALLVPLRQGGGSRLKVVESLGHGIPVISTRLGVEGLALRPDVDYLAAEGRADFERVLNRLQDDPEILAETSARGLVVAESYQWSTIARGALSALEEIVSAAPASGPAVGRAVAGG